MNLHVRAAIPVLGISALRLAACSDGPSTVTASAAAEPRSAPVAAATPPMAAPAGCDAPEGGDVPTPDEATTRQLILGSWLLCDEPSFFGTSDEIGLIIAADGHWAKLASDGSGHTVEMDGPANHGTWVLIDTSSMNGPGHFQINFTGLDGGTRISAVRITAPATLVLNNNGVSSLATSDR